jgi:hypothetical protein
VWRGAPAEQSASARASGDEIVVEDPAREGAQPSGSGTRAARLSAVVFGAVALAVVAVLAWRQPGQHAAVTHPPAEQFPVATWLPKGFVPIALEDRAATDASPAVQRRVDYGPYPDGAAAPPLWVTAVPSDGTGRYGELLPPGSPRTIAGRSMLVASSDAGGQHSVLATWNEDGWTIRVGTTDVGDADRILAGVRLVGRSRWKAERAAAARWIAAQPVAARLVLRSSVVTLHRAGSAAAGVCVSSRAGHGCAGWLNEGAPPRLDHELGVIVPVGGQSDVVVVDPALAQAATDVALAAPPVVVHTERGAFAGSGVVLLQLGAPARTVTVMVQGSASGARAFVVSGS